MLFTQGLYAITDRPLSPLPVFECAEAILKAGIKTLQYREKSLSFEEKVDEARVLKALCHQYGATFIINDSIELAQAVKADGIHLGQDDMNPLQARLILGDDAIIGWSTHSPDQVLAANNLPLDYIGFGPVFATSTKQCADSPRGLEMLAEILPISKHPVVAIGGINRERIAQLTALNCRWAAIISDVVACENPQQRATEADALLKQRT